MLQMTQSFATQRTVGYSTTTSSYGNNWRPGLIGVYTLSLCPPPYVQEPTCSQAFFRYRQWVDDPGEILRRYYPAASLELAACGSMILFIDFPGTAVADLPESLEGFPVPEQRGYVDAVNDDEGVVHVTLLGSSSSSSTVDTSQEKAELVVLDPASPNVKRYLNRVKQRAPQCTAPTASGLRCRNHTLKQLPNGSARCYCHMSMEIEDHAEVKRGSE
jgi:hypothetical protein